jgi:enoyl-CoA hydratase/carnithine racemase
MSEAAPDPVLVYRHPGLLGLVLNRPEVINTLNLEMVRRLRRALEKARPAPDLRLVMLSGAGERGFSAGGDLKPLARAVQAGALAEAARFFQEEYALDLALHQYPRAVAALTDGICLGGGLGLAAGADFIIATERTRMAMPETRIGFFPDVGATGWLFGRCPPGYPEFLALTGWELLGPECVRVGLATHLVTGARLPELKARLEEAVAGLPRRKEEAAAQLKEVIEPLAEPPPPPRTEMDAWVAEHFAGKETLAAILDSLGRCRAGLKFCADVFQRLRERSPTALAVTLRLLRANQARPLAEVFAREARAARFMAAHPDYLEGIRARLIHRDDRPRWHPATLEEVAGEDWDF